MSEGVNKERFTLEEVRDVISGMGYEMDERFTRLNMNLANAISEFTHDKLTLNEIFTAFDFLNDVLTGDRPDIICGIADVDRIRTQARLMEGIPETAGKLDDEEKMAFAFCVFFTSCILVIDPETDEPVSGLTQFTSVEEVKKLYHYDREDHPERYWLVDSDRNTDDSKPFGFSEDNPVIVTTVAAAYDYLNMLSKDGFPVEYERTRSMSGPNGIMDEYRVTVPFDSREYMIYIDPYGSYNSIEAPEGFELNLFGGFDDEPGYDERPEEEKLFDAEYDFRVLAHAFIGKDTESLFERTAADVIYTSEAGGVDLKGKEEIQKHFDYVRENTDDRNFCHKAIITEVPEESEYRIATECLLVAQDEYDSVRSICFVDHDEEGRISRILLTSNGDYRFQRTDQYYKNEPLRPDFYDRMLEINDEMVRQGQQRMSNYLCMCYSNVVAVLDEFSGHTMTYDVMIDVLWFIGDILDGREANFNISEEDSYRDIVRALRRYSTTKNIPYENMKLFAFALWYAQVYTRYDEEDDRSYRRIDEFDDVGFIRQEYEDMLAERPEFFSFNPDVSDITGEDYGLVSENPIEVTEPDMEYMYLNCIHFEDGERIIYSEAGEVEGPYGHNIHVYNIYHDEEGLMNNKEPDAVFYMYPFGMKCSFTAPKGFTMD